MIEHKIGEKGWETCYRARTLWIDALRSILILIAVADHSRLLTERHFRRK